MDFLLNKVIDEKRFTLLLQSVMMAEDPAVIRQQEVLLRIANDENKLIPGQYFHSDDSSPRPDQGTR